MNNARGLALRRCCDLGCDNVADISTEPDGWHKVSGFMNWVCPEHSAKWLAYEEASLAWSESHSREFGEAIRKFEETWDAEYEAKNPMPVRPESQPSLCNTQPFNDGNTQACHLMQKRLILK